MFGKIEQAQVNTDKEKFPENSKSPSFKMIFAQILNIVCRWVTVGKSGKH